VFHRHRYLAAGVRAAVFQGWKLTLCATAPKWHSDTVSAIMLPEGINGAQVIARAFTRYNLALGAGLSQVAGTRFRIGHLGDLNELMLLGGIAGAEMAMLDAGVKLEPWQRCGCRAELLAHPFARARGQRRCRGQDRRRRVTMRLVFLDRASLKAKVRKLIFDSEYVEHEKTAAGEIVPRLGGAAFAIVNKVPMRAETLRQLPQLKMIAVAATGYDVVDVPYCKEHGIAVANIRNYAVHHRARTCVRDDSRAEAQSARVPAGCRERRVEQIRTVLLLPRMTSAICTAARSVSSARAPSARARRPLGAHSACACCSPTIRRRRWKG